MRAKLFSLAHPRKRWDGGSDDNGFPKNTPNPTKYDEFVPFRETQSLYLVFWEAVKVAATAPLLAQVG